MTTDIPLCTMCACPSSETKRKSHWYETCTNGVPHPMEPIRDTNGWWCPIHDRGTCHLHAHPGLDSHRAVV